MKLIVCLGNPGEKYLYTRHNVGFLAADAFVDAHSLDLVGKKFKSIVYQGVISGEKVLVLKPQTFMNLSGEAVQSALSFYKLDLSDLLIVFDDFDLPIETVRLRKQGSGGTHNGVKSVVTCLGSRSFARLRVGIGPLPTGREVTGFVLGQFSTSEKALLPSILERCVYGMESFVSMDVDMAMNRVNASS